MNWSRIARQPRVLVPAFWATVCVLTNSITTDHIGAVSVAVLAVCVVCGGVCGFGALPIFTVIFIPGVLVADLSYEPPDGASGIDAMSPSASVLFVLPLLLAAVAIGAGARTIIASGHRPTSR